ncbi:MAG: HAD family phosphatase [Clostridia bacterium]|nr:HAD family phosphatase [Clostridia bacterium]
MDKKVYFFDVDGTLVDSMTRAWDDVILKYLDDRAVAYSRNLISELVTTGFMGIANYYVDKLGIDETPKAIYDKFMEDLYPLYSEKFKLKRGAKELIKKLKKDGAKVYVISGSPHRFVDACLKRHGIFDSFESVWSIEDFGYSKSSEKLYQILAEKVGAKPSDCVLIDDSINAIKTAKNSGFLTYGIFEITVEKYWQDMKYICDKVANDFTEFLND